MAACKDRHMWVRAETDFTLHVCRKDRERPHRVSAVTQPQRARIRGHILVVSHRMIVKAIFQKCELPI